MLKNSLRLFEKFHPKIRHSRNRDNLIFAIRAHQFVEIQTPCGSVENLAVCSVQTDQFVVGTLFYNFAFLHHINRVGIENLGKRVRNNNHGSAFFDCIKRVLDLFRCNRI